MERADTDKKLFDRIAQGDDSAFADIFHRYNRRLFHTIARMMRSESEAEELIQELFLKVWLKRESLNEIENPGGWLTTVAANLSRDALKKKMMMEARAAEVAGIKDPGQEPEQVTRFEFKETQSLIAKAVDNLPASRRKIFQLSREQGMSRREIADKLSISEHTVKNQLTSAIRYVQDFIQKEGGLGLPAILTLLLH